jgi:hypothetical protein
MPILKSKKHELVVGKFYLTYSSKSKNLSRNGTGGVIVEYRGHTAKGENTFKIPLENGKFYEMDLRNLDTRKDAFVVELSKENLDQLQFKIGAEGSHFPRYGEKTRERAAKGVELKYSTMMMPNERFPEERQDGTATFVFNIEGVERPVYLNNFQVKVTTDVLDLVCTAEELEAKRIAEERAKIQKMKEGGVRLAVGKMELGLKCLPSLLGKRKEFMKKSKSNEYIHYNSSFSVLYGDGETGEIKVDIDFYSAPCHASICDRPNGAATLTRLFIIADPHKHYDHEGVKTAKNSEAIRAWIDFMVNDSVYADIFIDKDVNAIIKYGYVINCDAPSNFIASALMATRSIYEYGFRGLAFHKLRQHLPANLAYFVCQHASGKIDKDGQLTSLTFTNTNPGHSPLDHGRMCEMAVIRLVLGCVDDNKLNDSMSMSGGYRRPHPVNDIFGSTDGERSRLSKLLVGLKYQPVNNKEPVNVFDIPKTDVDGAIKAAVEVAKAWANQYGI